MQVNQRDIVHVSLDPVKGREQRGTRPAVVISGNAFHTSGMCIICPLTSKIHNFVGDVVMHPSRVNNLDEISEVLVGHVRSVSQERIAKKFGVIEKHELEAIFNGLDLLLDR